MPLDPPIDKPTKLARRISDEINAISSPNIPNVRAVRRKYSHILKAESPELVISLSLRLLRQHHHRFVAYELLAHHPAAFSRLGEAEIEQLGKGIDSWWSVDSYARTLAGPAWLKGQISDELIEKWAHSTDRWWRRAALVSTVALNVRSRGGKGDTSRTLMICSLLIKDQDDMVKKAMSWALRELVVHDAHSVATFLAQNKQDLASRVTREVNNKLSTGLKTPRHKV